MRVAVEPCPSCGQACASKVGPGRLGASVRMTTDASFTFLSSKLWCQHGEEDTAEDGGPGRPCRARSLADRVGSRHLADAEWCRRGRLGRPDLCNREPSGPAACADEPAASRDEILGREGSPR